MSKDVKGFKIDPTKKYTFNLNKFHGGVHIIASSSNVWDKHEKRMRRIQLAKNFTSPYADEQDDTAIIDDAGILFKNGTVEIDGREEYKIRYLLAHDGNEDKGGDIAPNSRHLLRHTFRWKLLNHEEVYKDDLKQRKLKHELESKVLDASKEDLLEFLVSVYAYKPKTNTIEELIAEVLKKVQATPQVVKDKFATRETKLKSKIIGLFKDGTIKNTKGVVTWADGGLEVGEFKISEELKLVDAMIEWISKGTKEAKAFEKKLATL